MAAIDDLISIVNTRAPVICPQIYPFHSDVSNENVHSCLAGMFSEKQRSAVLKSLSLRQKKADHSAGRKTVLVMECKTSVPKRLVTVTSINFVSEIDALLYDTKKFIGLLTNSNDQDEIELYKNHFRFKNGYQDPTYEPFVVDEVYSAAYSLQVLMDSIPDWDTCLGTHSVPVASNLNIDDILDKLFRKSQA